MSENNIKRAGRTNFRAISALALVVILLWVLVIIEVTKSSPASTPPQAAVQKTTPAKTQPVSETPQNPVPETPQKPAVTQDTRKPFDDKMAEGQKALDERRYEEAIQAFEAARATEVDNARADQALQQARQSLAETKQTQREEELRAMLAEARRFHEARQWKSLTELYDRARKQYPELTKQIDESEGAGKVMRDEAIKTYQKLLGEAQAALDKEDFLSVQARLESAARFHPQGEEIKSFKSKLRDALLSRNMVRIAESDSIVGTNTVEDERPERTVHLKTFWMDIYEVTNEDYAMFVSETGHRPPKFWGGKELPEKLGKFPAVGVSRSDAEEYARWAGKRLPTEEEWEKAARFVDGRIFPWGNDFTKEDKLHCNSQELMVRNPGVIGPMAVGSIVEGASPYGVYDLAGNVWEWTSTSVKQMNGDQAGEWAVLKGGSFMTVQKAVRSSNRFLEKPSMQLPDVGFRCVKDHR